jgi:nitrite reductase/ring-hydroxylating ferredoxin subunit
MTETFLVPLGAADGRSRWVVAHNGRAYAVFVRDGGWTVTDAACPHRGGPLVDGLIRNGAIVCPWHWYAYDLESGRCRTTRRYSMRTYPVVIRDGERFAEVPVARPSSWSAVLRARAAGPGPDAERRPG